MIHPMVIVFATLVILGICFGLIFLYIHLYEKSEIKRYELDQQQHDTSVIVATGNDFSVRMQQDGESPQAYLSWATRGSYYVQEETMGEPAKITGEIAPEILDEIALSWIKYRDLSP